MVDPATVSTTDFVVTNDECGQGALAANASCRVEVAFRPSTMGAKSAILSVPTHGCGGGPIQARLAGVATLGGPGLVISPPEVDFAEGYQRCLTGGAVLRVSNGGTDPIGPIDVTLVDTFEVWNNHCYHATLAAQEVCEIQVGFPRWNPGTFSADLLVSAAGQEARAKLRGTVDPSYDPSFATPADFPLTVVGSASAPVEFVLQNPAGAPTTAFAVTVTNVAAGDFTIIDNGCDQPVAGGSSCRLHIAFAPTSTGVRDASLNARGMACGSGATTLQLHGVGYVP
jgi:hypothetical protein